MENVASGKLPLSVHVVPKKKQILNTLNAPQRCVQVRTAISTFPVSYLWCWPITKHSLRGIHLARNTLKAILLLYF